MSVEDENVVEIISTNEPQSTAVLTVSDHLDWLDTVQHQTLLQAKLNRYLACRERGNCWNAALQQRVELSSVPGLQITARHFGHLPFREFWSLS